MSQPDFPHYFTGHVIQGKIYQQSYEGAQQIGVVLREYNDLLQQHEELAKSYTEYQNKLIELGQIEAPISPEELVKQQAAQLGQMQQAMLQMQNQLNIITGVIHEHHVVGRAGCRDESEGPRNVDGCSADGADADTSEQLPARAAPVRKSKPSKAE